MRGDVDLREIKLKKEWFSRRNLIALAVVIAFAAGAVWTWKYITNPPRPWLVRWKLNRYLKGESHASTFKVEFPFPSKAEMARPKEATDNEVLKTASRTGKTFDALREEYLSQKIAAVTLERSVMRAERELKNVSAQLTNASVMESSTATLQERVTELQKSPSRRPELRAKEDALALIEEDLWEFQRSYTAQAADSDSAGGAELAKARAAFMNDAEKKMAGASSYDSMYKTIGEELFVAKGLLASGHPQHRRQGMTIALAVSRHAMNYAMNGGVAARICEGYILPNLDLANDTNPRSMFSAENLLRQCSDIFERNVEYNNVVRTYQMYLATVKDPKRADWARSRIGMAYQQAGDAKNALAAFREIKDTNSYRGIFMRTVPQLEKQLKGESS